MTSSLQRLGVDHVEGTGEREFDSTFEQVHQWRTRLAAGGERTEEDVEKSDESGDRPRQEDENEQPEETVTDSRTRHV